ncbi:hypothetical protein KIPB_007474 [Kipferlia bialata]|uniref:Uncharacterized protein n=1 Tax=Kipferlia bialata TaxID=797122 RepID=A0A391NX45_9EUKA|nr:hypothetical protein KIPB_007474 [Kipferlia bialata]|eukprot:g7474.t1
MAKKKAGRGSKKAQTPSESLSARALAAMNGGDTETALPLARRILEVASSTPDALDVATEVFMMAGQAEEAMKATQAAMTKAQGSPASLATALRLMTMSELVGPLDALPLINQAVSVFPPMDNAPEDVKQSLCRALCARCEVLLGLGSTPEEILTALTPALPTLLASVGLDALPQGETPAAVLAQMQLDPMADMTKAVALQPQEAYPLVTAAEVSLWVGA